MLWPCGLTRQDMNQVLKLNSWQQLPARLVTQVLPGDAATVIRRFRQQVGQGCPLVAVKFSFCIAMTYGALIQDNLEYHIISYHFLVFSGRHPSSSP